MFCIACGLQLAPDAKFCSKCGTSVSAATNAASAVAGSSFPGAAAAQSKHAHLSLPQAAGGVIAAGFVIWWFASHSLSATRTPSDNKSAHADSNVAAAQTAAPPAAAPPSAPEPVRTYYTVASGAPLCASFKGAVTAAAVMRSGNPMAIDAVLTRQGCDTSPQQVDLDPDASVQELQAGVVVINTPDGDHVYTTADSISTSRH